MDDRLQNAPVGVLIVSPDGRMTDINEVGKSLIDSTDDVTGVPLAEIFPRSVEDSLLMAFESDSITDTSFQEYYPELERWLSVSVTSTDESATVYLQDVTERKRYEQSIDQLRTERKRTAIIEGVLSEILAELIEATSREEIAETICHSLGDTDIYKFAWVGEREIGSDNLVIHAVGGEADKTFAAIRDALDVDAAKTLEERAIKSGRLQSAQPLADNPQVPESVWTAGFADGVQSALAIPLVYGSNVHGVVGVYAAGTEAFSDRERTTFETLGEVAGFAVTATRNRNLLLSDTVAELTFKVGDNSVLSKLSQSLNSTLLLEGLVPHRDNALLCFISVTDADIQTVEDSATVLDEVVETRAIRESDSGGTVELTIQGSTPLLDISSLGGTVRQADFDSGSGQVVVELPPDGDVRRIADTVSREYDMEFVAKEERERSVTTAREFRDALNDALTERQQTVLQTAYLADYFESPRGSTAEEVAASLNITGSTLLYHLRAGQRKLLDAYLSENTEIFEDR
ncbi:bacterio-opsin activator domain-containing protein [Halobellus rufus]|uniref:bacterio-opsin activator domain-containing protein n=1 Tax=Halobellus rufus TaxID=1448860 RepID=UPI000678C298|nr:bacterio-opsin activator domain-containing protein [Halobellus rufus]